MSDIVERLLSQVGDDVVKIYDRDILLKDAAHIITRLRADLAAAQERAERIETAAQELIKAVDATADHASWLKHIAALRAALGEPQ